MYYSEFWHTENQLVDELELGIEHWTSCASDTLLNEFTNETYTLGVVERLHKSIQIATVEVS